MAFATRRDRAAFGDGIGNMLFDLFDRLGIDQRAGRDTLAKAFADLELVDGRGELGDEGIIDALLHQHAVGADAGLACIAIFGKHGALNSGIEIGIVEHDERRVTAEFKTNLFHG